MKTVFGIFMILMLMLNVLYGQDPYFNTLPESEIKNTFSRFTAIGSESFYAVFKSTSIINDQSEYTFEKFNVKNLKRMESGKLHIPIINNKQGVFLDLLLPSQNPIGVYRYHYKSSGKSCLYVSQIPFEQTDSLKMERISCVEGLPSSGSKLFNYTVSPYDSSIFVATEEIQEFTKKARIHLIKWKSSGIEWISDIDIPFPGLSFKLESIESAANGSVYICGRIPDFSSGGKMDQVVVLNYNHTSKELTEYAFDIPGKVFPATSITKSNDGTIMASGITRDATSRKGEPGLFITELFSSSEENPLSLNLEFDQELTDRFPDLEVFLGLDADNITISGISTSKYGKTMVIAEQFFQRLICDTDPRTGMVNCTETYYFNDIFFFEFDQDLKLTKFYFQPRVYQSALVDDPFSSGFGDYKNEDFHYYFNDHPKNERIEDLRVKPLNNPRKAGFFRLHITEDGEVGRTLLTDELPDLVFQPKYNVKLPGGRSVVYGEKGKFSQIGVVSFSESE